MKIVKQLKKGEMIMKHLKQLKKVEKMKIKVLKLKI